MLEEIVILPLHDVHALFGFCTIGVFVDVPMIRFGFWIVMGHHLLLIRAVATICTVIHATTSPTRHFHADVRVSATILLPEVAVELICALIVDLWI